MSYTITEEKTYTRDAREIFTAARGAVDGLKGKVLKENGADGVLEIQFDKTILGKVLGDRTIFKVQVKSAAPESTTVAIEGYPIDAVGRKLLFGARKGVTRTVADWYWAHLEHRLGQ
jgi:hypothetical protein